MGVVNLKWTFLALAFFALGSTVLEAGPVNSVLLCNTGSPCSLLDRETTGPAQYDDGSISLYAEAGGYGLHTLARYDLNSPAAVTGQLSANAEFYDTLTATSLTYPDGTHAFLEHTFKVTGSTSGPADGVVTVILLSGTPISVSSYFKGNTTVNLTIPVVLGPSGRFNVDYGLSSEVFYGPTSGLHAKSDFADTAVLVGLKLSLDSDGNNPISDVTYTSASGIRYTQNGVVPEPGCLLLFPAGLAVVGLKRRLG